MFSLVSFRKNNEEKLYSVGDEIEFSLENGGIFKGTFEKVNNSGQVYFSNLKVKVGKIYKSTEGSLKISIGDIKEYKKGRGMSDMALLDSSRVLDEVVSVRGGVKFIVGEKVCVEVETDYGRRLYKGIYSGISDGSHLVIRDYISKDYLNLLSIWRDNIDSGKELEISVCKVHRMWYSSKPVNRYRIKISRTRKNDI